MEVRCEQPLGAWDGDGPPLRPGDVALVLALVPHPGGELLLRLLVDPDRGGSAFYPRRGLVTVGERPSARWVAGDGFALAPRAWLEPGFWDELAAGEPGAVEAYERECEALIAEGLR